MKQSQNGFTLIELVVVIVLLGILGVTALGKFQDLSGEAETAAVTGVASELTSSSSLNYAKSLVGTADVTIRQANTGGLAWACTPRSNNTPTILGSLFATNTFPADYRAAVGAAALPNVNSVCDAQGDTFTCIIYKDANNSRSLDAADPQATATITCTGI